MTRIIKTDIAIFGGGMGGCAAALAACHSGQHVVLVEETDWLGGQMTSQGVSAFDENIHIDAFSGTETYYALREGIRDYYYQTTDKDLPDEQLNPGNGWVSHLCFEPRAGLAALMNLLKPYIDNKQLSLLLEYRPTGASVKADCIQSVTVENESDAKLIEAHYFLDATELGDLLPLTNTDYVIGAESIQDTSERFAPGEAIPGEVQSFTMCFAVEFRAGEDHTIGKPDGYDYWKTRQPYSLVLKGWNGEPRPFQFFRGKLPFWTYRRMRDGTQLGGNDLALINWHGNDYFGNSIIDVSAEEKAAAIGEAKRLSLGFLHWLQTECPRDDGGIGYPELMLRKDVMDTDDGLAKYPYVRESRRIVALKRIHAQDILAENQPLARAANHRDSVGVGWYAMDLHPCVGEREINMFTDTKPFQIPLGTLIPVSTQNLLAACKNIGTTHLSNGAYRLHPIEWNIGESAGYVAAYCIQNELAPRELWGSPFHVLRLQYTLLRQGIPLVWILGIDRTDPAFAPLQLLLVSGILADKSDAAQTLEMDLDAVIPAGTLDTVALGRLKSILREHGGADIDVPESITWRQLSMLFQSVFDQLLS